MFGLRSEATQKKLVMIKDLKLDLAIQTAKMDETATRDTGELHGHPSGAGAGASVHKLHSDYRSSLSVQTTNTLLTISLESQPIEDRSQMVHRHGEGES